MANGIKKLNCIGRHNIGKENCKNTLNQALVIVQCFSEWLQQERKIG
jgi:hypothetical protein